MAYLLPGGAVFQDPENGYGNLLPGGLVFQSVEVAEEVDTGIADEVAGGFGDAYARRRWEALSRLPSADEIRAERERLGILPKRVRRAVEAVAERELADAVVDQDSLEQSLREFANGVLQTRAESALRSEMAARGQPYQQEIPEVLRAILADGLRRAVKAGFARRQAAIEEAEINEILPLWIDM